MRSKNFQPCPKCKMQSLILRSRHIRKNKEGFTLLELFAVVFIISLLTAVVLPSLYGLSDNKLKSDARKMASLLRYLNDSSISSKKTLSLKFDLQEGSILWQGPDGEKT